ncbi:class I SAM-dependent methyltransferase [Poseidonocella sp. HB161398]|uniref:class I SAM-dependent methyltransferase n=1 Tax=Poseidonocella sp. HB161398 TaxID=2320855 RepID=UPI001109EB64|nr:SAM-dependent methyltransferase [Poseidonocella sp. HB161398]
MTPLEDLLLQRIAATGPLSVAEYMAECLLHPEHGYYTTRAPFGAEGDFTTAPEISQLFGEMIGLCLAQAWIDRGRPAPFCLAELGPGRGTLMADIWRVTRAVPGFREAARVTLVEASPKLRARQAETLGGAAPAWCGSAGELPELPLFLVANEFFDALPVRQFQRDPGGWRERQIGLEDGRLALGLGPAAPFAQLGHRLEDTAPGGIVEICPALPAVTGEIARRIRSHGGAALVIDYGGWHSLGDTLQAVRRHEMVPVLDSPGQADLTAHVDFEAIAAAAEGCQVTPMVPQGVFLERLGITERARALASRLSGPALEAHVAAHRRLTHPDEMGTVFKTLGIASEGSPPVPGLYPWP